MNQTTIDLQSAIAAALAGAAPGAWERIVVNYEMQEEDGGLVEDRLAFVIAAGETGELTESEVAFTADLKAQFRALNDAMQRTEGARWGICDLVVDRPGTFRFDFKYGPPKRLNGVFDDESLGRFNRYLETYRSERRT